MRWSLRIDYVTGQPGIGKTRGLMMYALQKLLHLKAAAMYLGYKNDEAVLFLPDEQGNYRAWTSNAESFRNSRITLNKRVVALIDPSEKNQYLDEGRCRILKFVSSRG